MKIHLNIASIIIYVLSCFPSFAQQNKEAEYEIISSDVPYEKHFYPFKMTPGADDFYSGSADVTTSSKTASSSLLNTKFLGPYNIGARTRAFLVDKANSNHLLAGGTTSGLWKSFDAGSTWSQVDDQAMNLNVTYITQNLFNTNIIYYGTGEYIGNHTGVYGAGIFKSSDGGNTFSNLPATNNASFTYCQAIEHSLADSSTVFVATATAGLYRTTDGGNTFQKVFALVNNITDVECFADGRVWIGVSKTGVFQSMTGDSGTFLPLTNGLPATGFQRIEIAYCDNLPQNAYILYGDTLAGAASGCYGIWKTSNSGATWNVTVNPDNFYNFLYPKLNLTMAVKPDDPSFVVVGAGSLTYSDDGGTTWFLVSNVHFDQHSIMFDPNNFSILYNGSDGGVTRHSVSSMQTAYDDLNTGYNTQQFFAGGFFPTGNSIIAGAQDNWTQIGRNNDSIFIIIQTPGMGINGCYSHINQQNVNVSYTSGNTGLIFRSNNTMAPLPSYFSVLNELDADGDDKVDDEVWDVNPFEINLKDGNQLYFITKERVWRSVNGAFNWQPLTNTLADAPFALGISNDVMPTLYIGGEQGLFMRVDNAFSAVPGNEVDLSASVPAAISNNFISCLAVHPGNSSIVYASFSNYSNQPRIWKVTDANTASPVFTSISGNLPASLSVAWLEVDPLHPDSFIIAATDFGLYTTIDAGQTWVKETDIPNVSIPNIRLRKTDRKLFIFTHGRGAWVTDLNPVLTNICEPVDGKGISVLPNPSKGNFNISLLQTNLWLKEIIITDISGRVIQKLNYGEHNNSRTFSIDLNNETNGVYFINIITDQCELKKKLVKM